LQLNGVDIRFISISGNGGFQGYLMIEIGKTNDKIASYNEEKGS
jgi:hypothetical protein